MKLMLNYIGTFFLMISTMCYILSLKTFLFTQDGYFNEYYKISFVFAVIGFGFWYKTGLIKQITTSFNKKE